MIRKDRKERARKRAVADEHFAIERARTEREIEGMSIADDTTAAASKRGDESDDDESHGALSMSTVEDGDKDDDSLSE